jgi:hypothetical protein
MLNASLKMAIDLSFRKRSASGEHRDLIVNIGFDRQFSKLLRYAYRRKPPFMGMGDEFRRRKTVHEVLIDIQLQVGDFFP